MNEITMTISGNLTHEPELRYTSAGRPVTALRIASTPRRRDQSGQWQDAETTYIDAELWGPVAENVINSVTTGDRVIVFGTLRTQAWPDKATGEKRTRHVLHALEVGVSLAFATASPVKTRNGQASHDS